MGLLDSTLMIAIAGGAIWLLYHSLWKKKGCCGTDGCGGSCNH
ncbi:MAG: FeoB-associated Cys-rich membrane protein [Trichlorobacter sp.]|nr:FeoB-associated Cys-rich membrane protein [Trichlorobacter sp.]MDK9719167.1 FeoB-associated Cys-rich membrane protein [Trichlorobacter sp.]